MDDDKGGHKRKAGGMLSPPLGYPPLFDAVDTDAILSPPPRAVDINVGWVIEQPVAPSAFTSLLNLSRAKPPALALSVLPEITQKDFASYLSQLKAGRLRSGKSADEFSSDVLTTQTATEERASSSVHLTALPSRSSNSGPVADVFESVPKLYFRPDFDLNERGLLAGIVASGSLDSTQATLTAHLDLVECQLLGLIRSRAPQFFVALRDLQELQEIVTTANKSSQQLQKYVAAVKQECVIQPLYIVAASRRRQRLSQAASLMRHLRDATDSVAEVAKQVIAAFLSPSLFSHQFRMI
jgi:AraC-like DNA-binding protein